MIHTAEQMLLKFYTNEMSEPYGRVPFDIIIKAINEARTEAIKESADLCDETEDNRFEHKQSILKLIDQVK